MSEGRVINLDGQEITISVEDGNIIVAAVPEIDADIAVALLTLAAERLGAAAAAAQARARGRLH